MGASSDDNKAEEETLFLPDDSSVATGGMMTLPEWSLEIQDCLLFLHRLTLRNKCKLPWIRKFLQVCELFPQPFFLPRSTFCWVAKKANLRKVVSLFSRIIIRTLSAKVEFLFCLAEDPNASLG